MFNIIITIILAIVLFGVFMYRFRLQYLLGYRHGYIIGIKDERNRDKTENIDENVITLFSEDGTKEELKIKDI